ncbi:Oidioi.mRNA.OKI2018_I69.chr2.g5970.t1.cds [Oikopleura dioica]|uniref:Exocyst complex component 2 n=1 Tax=Oikopleura dioica TaxID=34765 RepID=A0ABN7T8J6_OIKDI|nr:Oidioi.mRNA.OKI2018_I69.chr2.g5970.t1.cds [Oikopleura dioica]
MSDVIPDVTGISPKEAKPGTKLTIRGNNFGKSPSDLVAVYVCGKNCSSSAEWQSERKIICRVAADCEGRGSVVVHTKRGPGKCQIQFTALKSTPLGPLEQSAVWVDEAPGAGAFSRSERGSIRPTSQDPLGLKKIADKPLQTEHIRLFPGQSPDPGNEQFSPTWFLLHHHKSTSFNDLKKGLVNLTQTSRGGVVPQPTTAQSASMTHIKDSLPIFFEVHEALNSIHGQMGKQSSVRGERPDMTDNLLRLLKSAESNSQNLFQDVLTQKDKADKIRNTLAVLQRFKLLFFLPGRVNELKDDILDVDKFSKVVSDVDKVRSLFRDTKVPAFQKVMKELHNSVSSLQTHLQEKLFESSVQNQTQIVRQLIELGATGDPTWDALQTSLRSMRTKNFASLEKAQKSWNNEATSIRRECISAFVEEVLTLFKSVLPDLWKLWNRYSNGTLISNDAVQSSKLKQLASTHAKEVKRLFSDEILHGVSMIRAAVLHETLQAKNATEAAERREYGIWPEACCSAVNAATMNRLLQICRAIDYKGIYGSDHIKELCFDFRVQTIRLLMEELLEEIKSLKHQEDWELLADGGTNLPKLFVSAVDEFCLLVREPVKNFPNEEVIFDRIQVETELRSLIASILCQFPVTLSQLATMEAPANLKKMWLSGAMRLVTVLSNSIHSRITKMNHIEESLTKIGFPDARKVCITVQRKFAELDNRLIEGYLETRRDPIVCAVEPGMYAGMFDWGACPRPTQVRPYVKLCLIEVVAVHAELHSVSQKLLASVLPKVIDGLGDEFVRLLGSVSKFSAHGGLQARIEIRAIEECTALYSSPRSKELFEEALKLLPPVTGNEERQLEEQIMQTFRKQMRIQLMPLRDN